jgi:hypothetical protein
MLLLLAVHILIGSNCRVEEPDYTNADRYYVAIAKVPAFFTEPRCGDDRAAPVAVYVTRSTSRKIGEIRWAKGGDPKSWYCIPFLFVPGQACPRGTIPLMEDGYEESAFVVLEGAAGWARIRLDRGSGWIRLAKGDEVMRYEDLVVGRLAELTTEWDGRIYTTPGGRSRLFKQSHYRAVTVTGSRRVKGELWFHLRLTSDVCAANEPRTITTGWVRAYSAKHQPTVRHFSRGC